MCEALSSFSLNTRGLGDKRKRRAVFSWPSEKGVGIFLLHECHSCNSTETD